jgi:hypothetical protein
MNADLTPALIAGSGGPVLLATIWAVEAKRDAAMRASRKRYQLRFPVSLTPEAAFAAVDGFAGLPMGTELVAETSAAEGAIHHALWVPEKVVPAVRAALSGPIPSLRLSQQEGPGGRVTLALKIFIPTPAVLHTVGAEAASRALLAGLAILRDSEAVVVRWSLRPGKPRPTPDIQKGGRVALAVERGWRAKTGLPGLFAAGLVLVKAPSIIRARELADHVASSIRSRQGQAGAIRITAERGNRTLTALPTVRRRSGWLSTAEILPLLAWPLGSDAIAGVELGASRELLVPGSVPREGRVLFVGRDVQGERPVALATEAALLHTAIVGKSGSGKSVLLARNVLSNIEQGFGGALIDPKGPDLVDLIVERVKKEHAHRIVVVDPGDTSRPVPGINVLRGGDPDLRTDVLVSTLKAIFADAWGVRADFYGRLAIRTLSEVPGATLADMGRLFFEEPYLHAAISRLRDPFLISAWQSYLSLSGGSRAEHVQAPMSRMLALLSRPKIRAVLASPDPKLDIGRLFAERKWLLVSLSPGQLGESGAAIIGAAFMYAIWAAIEARSGLRPDRRHPLFLYVDELASVANGLPFGFELLAERARGLGAGLTVALQTLSRIPEPTRSAVLGNASSFITFAAPAEEAPKLAAQIPGLTPLDVQALQRFEVAARIATATGVVSVTGRTEPLPPVTGMAAQIRDQSAQTYGSQPATSVPGGTTDTPPDETPVGQKRRQV